MIRALGILALALALAANPKVGVFEGHTDIGSVLHAGTVEVENARYTVSGSGENMWFAADEFHFVWQKMTGDVAINADISILGAGGSNHRKAALMVRQSLDSDAAYVDAALHGDGLTSMQYRDEKGAVTREIQSRVSGPRRLRLEKRGDAFYMSIAAEGAPFAYSGGWVKVAMKAPFYVGLAVCAHDKNAVERAAFSKVEVSRVRPAPLKLYSTVETTAVSSGDRRAVHIAKGRIESPVWTRDGAALVVTAGGELKRLHIATGVVTPIYTGDVRGIGSYHAVSPDGSRIVFSNESGAFTVPIEGGIPAPMQSVPAEAPRPATNDEYDNFSVQPSPDGQKVAFLSLPKGTPTLPRDAEVLLRVLSVADGKVKTIGRMTGGQGTMDSPSWSPDSKRIAWVSYQMLPE